jgi:hypothetical protein
MTTLAFSMAHGEPREQIEKVLAYRYLSIDTDKYRLVSPLDQSIINFRLPTARLLCSASTF